MPDQLTKVDHGALKANQLVIITLNIAAFVFNLWPIAALVALVMAVGTALGKPGFLPVYRYVLKPLRVVAANPLEDDPRPHRFAQGFGAVVMIIGAVALSLGSPTVGWTAVWIVVLLAAVNAFAGFCAGCFVFYQLARLKVPGFSGEPPAGTFPGTRPKESRS
jgi:hypothetical protein